MKFSILVANYNNGNFFKSCYDSIISQKYDQWEAIILDDASTDDSLEVIKKTVGNDARFKIYQNAENSGVGITKSKLIDLSSGDICGFVDPDDAITPTALLSSINVFKKNKDVALTYSKFIKCDKNLVPIEVAKLAVRVPNNDPYFFNCPINIAHFVAFRKDIYEQTEKMNTTMKIAEDQDLYMKIYEKGKVYFINEPNYFYRMHSGGISQNENKPLTQEYFAKVIFNAMQRRNLKTINGRPVPENYKGAEEIFSLLEYQNKIPSRIKKKILITLQKIFG